MDVKHLVEKLKENNKMISLMESCTGGGHRPSALFKYKNKQNVNKKYRPIIIYCRFFNYNKKSKL